MPLLSNIAFSSALTSIASCLVCLAITLTIVCVVTTNQIKATESRINQHLDQISTPKFKGVTADQFNNIGHATDASAGASRAVVKKYVTEVLETAIHHEIKRTQSFTFVRYAPNIVYRWYSLSEDTDAWTAVVPGSYLTFHAQTMYLYPSHGIGLQLRLTMGTGTCPSSIPGQRYRFQIGFETQSRGGNIQIDVDGTVDSIFNNFYNSGHASPLGVSTQFFEAQDEHLTLTLTVLSIQLWLVLVYLQVETFVLLE